MTENEMLAELEQTMSEIREIKSGLASAMTKLNAIQGNLKSDKKEREKKAYDHGYKDGEENGIREAMSAFKSIFSRGWDDDWRAMGFDCPKDDWTENFEYILDHYDPTVIVEKVKAYKEEKGKIHVGDEVVSKNGSIKFIVTKIDDETMTMLSSDGQCAVTHVTDSFKRTGRHFDVLAMLRGISDED